MRWIFPTLLLAAALLRFCALGSNPAGVFRDEAIKGYLPFCLAETGTVLDFSDLRLVQTPQGPIRSPHPIAWPLFVDFWGSNNSMISQYASLPLVALWGMSAWTVRAPSALIGVLTVWMAFLLARALTGRNSVALWAMAILTFSPWHIIFSRHAHQGIFVPFFLTAGSWAFLCCLERRRRGAVVLSLLAALCFGLAFYSYSGARPFLLVFAPVYLILWRKEIRGRWRVLLPAFVFLLLLLIPTFHAMFGQGGAGLSRWRTISVFALEDRTFAAKMLLFVKNYLSHYSPSFLFLTGDANDRHSLRGFGQMLHLDIIFLVVGLVVAFKRRGRSDLFLLAWFLLFPISAAMTREGIPHAARSLHGLPCPQILAAMGLVATLDWARSRGKGAARAVRGLLVLYGLNAAALVIALFCFYPRYSAPAFEYSVAQALKIYREAAPPPPAADNRRLFVILGEGLFNFHELYHFHLRTHPEAFKGIDFDQSPVQFLLPEIGAQALYNLTKPDDALLMSAAHYAREFAPVEGNPSFQIEVISQYPAPNNEESTIPGLVLVTRK